MPSKEYNRKQRKSRKDRDFDQKIVDLARVARVVAGGRRFRFRATVVIGDRKGKVGVATGKGGDVSSAIQKAVDKAKKGMIRVALNGTTIPYEVQEKLGGAVVFLRPASAGTGIIAGGSVRAVLELAGVQDILSKMLGSGSKTNNAIAAYAALAHLKTPEQLMKLRGKTLKKKSPEKVGVTTSEKPVTKEEK